MAGIDYLRADIDLRERVSFTPHNVREVIKNIKKIDGVFGVALLCTCNRTEIYISYNEKEYKIDPVAILCESAKVETNEFSKLFFIRENEQFCLKYVVSFCCNLCKKS